MKNDSETIILLDNLGRVVIPKLYRESIGIQNDRYVAIKLRNNEIVLSKSINKNYLDNIEKSIIKPILKVYKCTVIYVNNEKIERCYGIDKKNYITKQLNKNILTIINETTFKYKIIEEEFLFNDATKRNFIIISLIYNYTKIGNLIIIGKSINNGNEEKIQFLYELLFYKFN